MHFNIKIDDKDHILLALQETDYTNDYKIYALEHKETLDNYIKPSLFYSGIEQTINFHQLRVWLFMSHQVLIPMLFMLQVTILYIN